jgi:hypothetical protein
MPMAVTSSVGVIGAGSVEVWVFKVWAFDV